MGVRILIVDDEGRNRELLREILEPQGYTVQTASDGLEGLEAVRQATEPFNLIITDWQMPKMNGIVMARHIKELKPNLPILLFTSAASYLETTPEGIDLILAKGTRIAELRHHVKQLLNLP